MLFNIHWPKLYMYSLERKSAYVINTSRRRSLNKKIKLLNKRGKNLCNSKNRIYFINNDKKSTKYKQANKHNKKLKRPEH